MKKHLLAAAITVLAASSAFAQANDTLATRVRQLNA